MRNEVRNTTVEIAKPEWEIVGKRLASIRERLEIKQPDRARQLGVSKTTYGRWERGVREIGVDGMAALVREGWNAHWILTGDGPERFDALSDEAQDMLLVALRLPGWEEADRRITARIRAFSAGVSAVTKGSEAMQDKPSNASESVKNPSSQSVVSTNLKMALVMVEDALAEKEAYLPPARRVDAAELVCELLARGLPEAEVVVLARQTVGLLVDGTGSRNGGTTAVGGQT